MRQGEPFAERRQEGAQFDTPEPEALCKVGRPASAINDVLREGFAAQPRNESTPCLQASTIPPAELTSVDRMPKPLAPPLELCIIPTFA